MGVFAEIFVLLLCYSSTLSIEESFCAGTGYSNLSQTELGLRSVGYKSVYSHPLSTIWAANHIMSTSTYQPDAIEINLNVVEQTLPTGTTVQLNGWLYVDVTKRSGSFEALALWAATDTREPIGEFFNLTGANGCASWPQAREVLPCSAAPIDASINPNMFVYANTAGQNGNELKSVKIFWKMSTAYCNKPKMFRFYAATSSKAWNVNTPPFPVQDGDKLELGPLIYTSPWITPKFTGAPSPVYDLSSIKCTKDIYKGKPVWLKGPAHYMLTEKPELKWLLPRWKSDGTEDTQVARERATCKATDKNIYVHHGGRCKGKVIDAARVYGDLNTLPICNHVAANFDAEDLNHFTGSLTNKLLDVEKYLKNQCECPVVPTTAEVQGLITSRKLNSRSTWKKRQREAEFENYQDKVEDDDVDTIDDEGINDSANIPQKFQTSFSVIPGLPMHKSNLSYNLTRLDIFRHGFNLTTTTDDPDYFRAGVDEEINKDDAHIKCALQHKNFSDYNDLGLCLDSTAGRIVYGIRQFHATATLLCTVVLVPVASYMARYHKGAIPIKPSGSAYLPVRVWYIVHILIILPILCMYTTGMVSVRRQRSVLGYSLTFYGKFHRIGGTVLIVLMIFQVLTGFLRPLNMFCRKLAIWVHFIIGLIINYVVICILTYRIPGSPTAFQPHIDSHLFNPLIKHIAPMILVFWGVADIAYQAFITVHIIQFDKSVGVERSYFPVIIPVIQDTRMQFDDEYAKERIFQKGTFTAYIIFSNLIFFIVYISIYCLNDDRGQGFGPMYCTHDDDGQFFDPTERGKVTNKRGYCN